MRVDPALVLRLKRELEDIRDDALDFVTHEGASLALKPMGADPVSDDVSDVVSRNADTALACMRNYIDQLTATIDSLARTAEQYDLVDGEGANAFRAS